MSDHQENNQELLDKLANYEKNQKILQQHVNTKNKIEEKLQGIADSLSLLVDNEKQFINQFNKNITAFEKYFPDIASVFKNYQPEKFEIVLSENYANILDTSSDELVYEYPAYLMALAQVSEYQLSPQSTNTNFFLHNEELGTFLHSTKLNEIVNILNERKESDEDKLIELPKNISAVVIFGVGLGYHLELLNQQHQLGSVYIIEPELDVFFASLFTCNWAYLLPLIDQKGGNLHISLGPQEESFFDELMKETYNNGRYEIAKTYGYIHYNTPKIKQLLIQYQARFFEMIQGWGFFDDGIMALAHFLESIKLGVPIIKKDVPLNVDIANAPVFIIGNGPSLDQSIEMIKAQQEKVIIISCGSALSALYNYGIDIDFHCEQERIFAVAEKIDYYAPKEYLKKQTLLATSTLHPAVYEKFGRSIMGPKASEPSTNLLLQDEEGRHLFEEALYISPTVANTALVMATKMGFRNFYFVGVDLGHKEQGAHHSQNSFYYNESGEDIELYPTDKTQFTCQGNFGGEFTADPIFNMSRIMLEKFIAISPQISCFNLSDGAKIKGCQPLTENELNLVSIINKEQMVDNALELSSFYDDGYLYQRLILSANVDGFRSFCTSLVEALKISIDSVKEAHDVLRMQTYLIKKIEVAGYMHFSSLLNGSMLHMQAMLLRLLTEAKDPAIALADFNKGLVIYREFLIEAPDVYQKHYKTPQHMETLHLKALRKTK